MTETSARFGLPYLAAGQAQKEVTHNEALALLDIAANASVIDAGVNTPIVGATAGQCWIVGTAPVGVWAGEAGSIAGWTGGGWRFVRPIAGMRVWVIATRELALFEGGSWVLGDVRGRSLIIGGDAVVGSRLSAVSAPSGGTTIDIEARAAIDTILARLRQHGLIAA